MAAVIDLSTWKNRKTIGDAHELHVREELHVRGWATAAWGQGLMSEPVRQAVQRISSPLRFEPDMIAVKWPGPVVCFIDAKGSATPEAEQCIVSRRSLQALRDLNARLDIPVYYVFARMGVATPEDIMQFCGLGSLREAGSFVRFDARYCASFDLIFGLPETVRSQVMLEAA